MTHDWTVCARLFSAQHQRKRRFGAGSDVVKCADLTRAAAMTSEARDGNDATATRRSIPDAASSRTTSSQSSPMSSPRTYVVDVLPTDTDDENSSRPTSPRVADRLARRCRRRLPAASTSTKDGRPEVGYSSNHSSSTETLVRTKPIASDSLQRQRRRRCIMTSPNPAAAATKAASSIPVPPEIGRRPPGRRPSSASSEGDVAATRRAQPAEIRRGCVDDFATKKASAAADDRQRSSSRLPRLVVQPQDSLPSSSSVSETVLRAPRPRSFRYSRLHRRAVNALVPPPLRDIPWRWAWKAKSTG